MESGSEGTNPSFRYQALAENAAQPNSSEPSGPFALYDENALESPLKTDSSRSEQILSLLRQGVILGLLVAIFAGWLFSSSVGYERKSADLFSSGLCSRSPVTKFSSRYAVVFDAGSTGSRVHVYEFRFCGQTLLHLVDELFEQVKPGLSSYSERPEAAAESIAPLMRQAWRRVPRHMRRCTPIVLKATAGLRLLPRERVAVILEEVKRYLAGQNFYFGGGGEGAEAVSVIDGSEEAISAWISVNFLQKRIGPQQQGSAEPANATSVVLEMGGGSAQIVFDLEERTAGSVPGAISELQLFGRRFQLYQHSYLGYGLMEARRQVKLAFESANRNGPERPFPCYPRGYSEELGETGFRLVGGSAGWEACMQLVRQTLFDKDASCQTLPCSFNGVFQPKIPEHAPIFALSYIFDRARELGLSPDSYTLGELKSRGQKVCLDGFEGNLLYQKAPEFCLDLVFIHSLLGHGYGISEDRKIQSGLQIGSYETGWTLGSALTVIGSLPEFCSE